MASAVRATTEFLDPYPEKVNREQGCVVRVSFERKTACCKTSSLIVGCLFFPI